MRPLRVGIGRRHGRQGLRRAIEPHEFCPHALGVGVADQLRGTMLRHWPRGPPDHDLFDVTRLIAAGHEDAYFATLPVIVRGPEAYGCEESERAESNRRSQA